MNLTREEIENIPAGRDIDAWIAQEIIGLARIDLGSANCPYCGSEMWQGKDRARCSQCNEWRYSPYKEYSAEISAAWEVVEKLHLMVRPSILSGNWVAMKFERVYLSGKWEGVGEATADTAPLAICRAALLAILEK